MSLQIDKTEAISSAIDPTSARILSPFDSRRSAGSHMKDVRSPLCFEFGLDW